MSTNSRTENKTFHTNDYNIHMNACVGRNGWNDIVTYCDGYKYAVDSIYKSARKNTGYVDCYVYPLCFTARHYIELFLKRTITDVQSILEEQGKNNDTTIITLLKKTHDLAKLYDLLKEKSELFDDRLFQIIIKLEEYIRDFAELDPTGEVFRYPYNQNDEHSLDNLSCINLDDFYKRFCEIKQIEDDCYYLFLALKKEYKTGTYTQKCSRYIIEQIANELPVKSTWSNPNFDVLRVHIKQKYNLSSKELSNVINIIKAHPEFSEKIDCPIKTPYITHTKYALFEMLQLTGEIEECSPIVCGIIGNLFSKEELGCLDTFLELGKDKTLYSENFQKIFEYYKNLDITDLIRHLFYYPESKRKWILEGIRKCGQSHLLKY